MKLKWYTGQKARVSRKVSAALEMTAHEIRRDIRASQTLPWAEDSEENRNRGIVPGELNENTFIDAAQAERGKVSIVSNTPYARRLYFHPEYNFYRGTNKEAGGLWFEPYMTTKRKWVRETFGKLLGKQLNG